MLSTIAEQTHGKHLILRHYLSGWLPILGSSNARLLFVDGFAGPGKSAEGQPGSPLIALDCIRRQKHAGRLERVEVLCLFIESNMNTARILERTLGEYSPIPDVKTHVLAGTFTEHMTHLLNHVDGQKDRLSPSFVMIDPFGVKGVSMRLISRIIDNEKSECMISFMYEPIRRFRRHPGFEQHIDELFGTGSWRLSLSMDEEVAKKFLHALFLEQLKSNGAKFAIPFELWRGSRHVYTIFFVSNSLKGCNLMKASIWRIEPSGTFSFRGRSDQLRISFDTDTEPLVGELRRHFGNRPTPVEQIEDFVMGDGTIFHQGHLRNKTLRRLEREGRLTVSRPNGGSGFPRSRGIVVQFVGV